MSESASPDPSVDPSSDPSSDPSVDRSFDHGAISSFNAWFFTALDRYINHVGGPHKQAAFGGIEADTVVELGAGTGANLRYLSPGTTLHAVEPSRKMHPGLRRRAEAAGVELRLHAGMAERIDLPDASVDEVLCSLVLCTVDDPDRVLGEVRRVLRPGGRFRFVEHVAAAGGIRGRIQRWIRRPWGWLFEGCDPHRHTHDAVERAGFADLRLEHRRFRHSLFWPVNTAVWGVAVR